MGFWKMEFICEVCGTAFLNKEALRVHNQIHDERELPCIECGKLLKGLKVNRKIGTQKHKENSLKSIVWHNSRRAGFTPPSKFRIRSSCVSK